MKLNDTEVVRMLQALIEVDEIELMGSRETGYIISARCNDEEYLCWLTIGRGEDFKSTVLDAYSKVVTKIIGCLGMGGMA